MQKEKMTKVTSETKPHVVIACESDDICNIILDAIINPLVGYVFSSDYVSINTDKVADTVLAATVVQLPNGKYEVDVIHSIGGYVGKQEVTNLFRYIAALTDYVATVLKRDTAPVKQLDALLGDMAKAFNLPAPIAINSRHNTVNNDNGNPVLYGTDKAQGFYVLLEGQWFVERMLLDGEVQYTREQLGNLLGDGNTDAPMEHIVNIKAGVYF